MPAARATSPSPAEPTRPYTKSAASLSEAVTIFRSVARVRASGACSRRRTAISSIAFDTLADGIRRW